MPHYRIQQKILVRRDEFDAWMVGFRYTIDDLSVLANKILLEMAAHEHATASKAPAATTPTRRPGLGRPTKGARQAGE